MGGSSDPPGSVQSRYKVDSGNPWEKNFHPWKKISTRGKKIPQWKSQVYRLNVKKIVKEGSGTLVGAVLRAFQFFHVNVQRCL